MLFKRDTVSHVLTLIYVNIQSLKLLLIDLKSPISGLFSFLNQRTFLMTDPWHSARGYTGGVDQLRFLTSKS